MLGLTLFNLAFEHTVVKIPVDTKGTLLPNSTQVVTDANDIFIFGAKEGSVEPDDVAKELELQKNSRSSSS